MASLAYSLFQRFGDFCASFIRTGCGSGDDRLAGRGEYSQWSSAGRMGRGRLGACGPFGVGPFGGLRAVWGWADGGPAGRLGVGRLDISIQPAGSLHFDSAAFELQVGV